MGNIIICSKCMKFIHDGEIFTRIKAESQMGGTIEMFTLCKECGDKFENIIKGKKESK